MRALSVIWKIYDDRLQEFAEDTTGLIVVRDLCEFLGRKIESYLLLGKEYISEINLGNIHVVDSKSIAESNVGKPHLEIMKEVFEKTLMDIKPDIVHIHDSGDFCRMCMKICIDKRVPYVFTAHGFIEKDQKITNRYKKDIEYQKEVFTTPNIHVVAVGKGLANKIVKEYPNLKNKQLKVIQNGTEFKAEIFDDKLRDDLKLHEKKILICPGKITERKNQIQIVRAFQLLPESIKEKICILFCGNDRLNGKLIKVIKDAGLEEQLRYIGILSSEQMKKYYFICDGFITASITEGLSIAALEALAYGLPLIMFSDIECAIDLNDERIACFAQERTDEALAMAIQKWLYKEWDKNAILQYSNQFSMERVAEDYLNCYQDILNEKVLEI